MQSSTEETLDTVSVVAAERAIVFGVYEYVPGVISNVSFQKLAG
jgi:hypothetical protein